MDFATLVGLVGAIVVIALAVFFGGSLSVFANPASIAIVVMGTLFVVLSKFSFSQFLNAFRAAGRAFKFRLPDTGALIEEVVEVADIARKKGMLELENHESSSSFFQQGIRHMIDGQDPETTKALMAKERLMTLERNRMGSKVFHAMGDVAPAMGMIGTIIGLVQMLSNMEDPKSIGPAMAVALLTTLYGAMIANMVAIPIADKLELRITEEARMQALVIDAVTTIQQGQNPRVVEQMLSSYLPPEKREQSEEAA
ncbi:chemotaxis protein MotA [Tamilnaduibacter salinus]|uniref:Chemotaxis protein MotA n=1 Tax=Tamilnaduibacter salinus TaxID=1484056 RepID=A0A2A2I7E3_9GAMM|nr:flagellar motor protein PomA [Tamilnaduibacter salinus]PAV27318.1 flagellar motor protein PomA [Tamilnaduibacter salinus]PVY70304.1 chemotaxis protein MotA [Tamilnaduibacter salinus]